MTDNQPLSEIFIELKNGGGGMAKNIVLCSDGTGNSGGVGNSTNIWRLFTSIDVVGFKEKKIDIEQVTFYDDGVGTDRGKLLRMLGGAFGLGLARNVRQLYLMLVKSYEPGDHIYLFGYSRGAFTVRTLAGMVRVCGILDKKYYSDDRTLNKAVWNLYRAYRRNYPALLSEPWYKFERIFGIHRSDNVDAQRAEWGVKVSPDLYRDYHNIDEFCDDYCVPIRFIGVWDTVDAVGFSIDALGEFWNRVIFRYKFPDRKLNLYIENACQALSIDDDRKAFYPQLFDQQSKLDKTRIEQVWFPGVHGNVGGGLPKQGMEHVSLNWMIRQVEAHGLVFYQDAKDTFRDAANENDKLYDARAGFSIYYRYGPRNIFEMTRDNRTAPAKIHISALKRIAMGTEKYAPGNIPATIEIEVDNENYVGENKSAQKKIKADIANKVSTNLREYKQSHLVDTRMMLHKWFWIATLIILGTGAILHGISSDLPDPEGFLFAVMKLVQFVFSLVPLLGNFLFENFIRPLFLFPSIGVIVLLIPVILYVVDFLLQRKLSQHRQRVWRKIFDGPWW